MPLTLKVVLIGDSGVGKTAVMRRFLGELFDPTFIMTTAGETLKRKRIIVDKHHVQLELWDAPGNESFRTDVAVYMKNAKAVVVFFDVSNYRSFEDIDNWLKFIPEAESPSQKPPTFIIGNKTDKTPRCVKKEQAEHKAKKRESLYFETSAKDSSFEYFNQIFHKIIEDVLNKSPGITSSGSMTANQRPAYTESPWYKKCVLL